MRVENVIYGASTTLALSQSRGKRRWLRRPGSFIACFDVIYGQTSSWWLVSATLFSIQRHLWTKGHL
jgi:hypothetical protein